MARRPVIALLGGGQLGRMFIENALRYNVAVHVLDPDANAPCATLATRFVQGRFDDRDTVLAFAEDADVIGIEIEHVNVEALEELQAMGKTVIPDPAILRTIQDKGLQKQFYQQHDIPTPEGVLINGPEEILVHSSMLPAFLKQRKGGYDGKGVMPINHLADLANAFPGPSVLERRTDIAMELAVSVVRSTNGTMVAYDPVEMVFDPRYNLVDHLRAPARITLDQAGMAVQLARRVAEAFGGPGLYAVELFLTHAGELLVNETAPRAHNSGHHSIEACPSSQFDQLLRLYMNWPLGATHLQGFAAMVNLVGEGGTGEPQVNGLSDVLHVPGTFLHMYGKHETRTGRKMGHVTVLGRNHNELDLAIAVTRVHCNVIPINATITERK